MFWYSFKQAMGENEEDTSSFWLCFCVRE